MKIDWFEIKYALLKPVDEVSWLISRIKQAMRYFMFGFNDQTWNGYKFDELVQFKVKLIREVVAADTNYTEESNKKNLREIDLILKLLDRSLNYNQKLSDKAWENTRSEMVDNEALSVPGKYSSFTIEHYDIPTGRKLTDEETTARFKDINVAYDREEKIKEIAFIRAMKIINSKRFGWD